MLLSAFGLTVISCGDNPPHVSEEQAWIEQEGTGVTPTDLDGFRDPGEAQVRSLSEYAHLDPGGLVPKPLLEQAVAYFDVNKDKFANQNVISVIDFSRSSRTVRLWVIDMASGAVWPMRTAHGKGSDANDDGIAESFGNVNGSGKSSLGFYRTAETYQGRNGYSLRLDGLSPTNSNARARAVVVHGANYVNEVDKIQGRSLGCPAITHDYRDKLIDRIKNGSLIYAGLSNNR